MSAAILIAFGVLIGVLGDRCYLDAREADRREKLKGIPRRYNESGASFEWWDR